MENANVVLIGLLQKGINNFKSKLNRNNVTLDEYEIILNLLETLGIMGVSEIEELCKRLGYYSFSDYVDMMGIDEGTKIIKAHHPNFTGTIKGCLTRVLLLLQNDEVSTLTKLLTKENLVNDVISFSFKTT